MVTVGGIAVTTVLLGALNNVTSKMRSVTFGPFNYMVVLMNSALYLTVYSIILYVRYSLGIVDQKELNMFWGFNRKARHKVDNPKPVLPKGDDTPLLSPNGDENEIKDQDEIPLTKFNAKPWKIVLIAGLMDATGNLMGFVAQAHLPQVLYQLFLQNLVLFSVFLSMIILGSRYSIYHVVGLFFTIFSGVIGLIPDLQGTFEFKWGTVAALSTLPTAISYVCKERLFHLYEEKYTQEEAGASLDVFVVNTHVAIVQLIVTPLLAPLNVLIGETNGAPFGEYLHDGYRCLVFGSNPKHLYHENTLKCQYALRTYFVYILCNMAFNVSLVALTKYGSSVQSWLVVRLLLPTTLILLLWHGWPLLSASDRGINMFVVSGAVLAFAGATIFRYSTLYIERLQREYQIRNQISCLWPLRT